MGFIRMSHEGAMHPRASTYINPYTPKHRGMSDIYSVASYRYFGGTSSMAHLASG